MKITDAAGTAAILTPPLTMAEHRPPLYGSDRYPVADLKATYKAPKSARLYGPNGMPSAALINSLPDSVVLVHCSYKGPTDVAAVKAALTGARRPGRRIVVEPIHEMNRAVKNGGPTPAAYKALYDPLAATVRALDPSGEELGLIQTFMGWAARHLTTDRAWQLFARDDVDLIGVDLEWDDSLGTTAYPTPEALQAIAYQIRDAHPAKKPLTIPELAWRRLAYDTSGADEAKLYVDQCAYADDNDVYAVNIYDTDGSTGPYKLLAGSPALAAAQKIIG